MILRWIFAAVHLLALGVGLGSIFARGRALQNIHYDRAIQRALVADSFWGLSALLWIPTGLLRAFGGFEKGSAFYLGSNLFWVKMGLLLLVLGLEIKAIAGLTKWRLQLRRGSAVDTGNSKTLSRISYVQTALIVVMVLVATAMARGLRL